MPTYKYMNIQLPATIKPATDSLEPEDWWYGLGKGGNEKKDLILNFKIKSIKIKLYYI